MSAKDYPREDGEPPWGGWDTEFRPELLPPVDPAEFRAAIDACVPKAWPEEFPDYVWRPVLSKFKDELYNRAEGNARWFVPIYQRFLALLRLLEGGELGPGWPSQVQLLRGEEEFMLHPAVFYAASQLPLSSKGYFDPVEFRHETVRAAKRMGLALPPGLPEA